MILIDIKDFMFFIDWLTCLAFVISCMTGRKYVTVFLHFLMTACYGRAV